MADKKNEGNFVGGSVAGITPATPTDTSADSSRRSRGTPPGTVVVRKDPTKPAIVQSPREPLDTDATILYKDLMGRPYEQHPDSTWEARKGITRRFKPGDRVWLIMRMSIQTEEFIQKYNEVSFLAEVSKKLPSRTSGSFGTVHYIESFKYHVDVLPGESITVGLCPLYLVQVVDGPAKGLRMLCFPSDLMDDTNIDGYGVDRLIRRRRDGLSIPEGFTLSPVQQEEVQ